MKDSSGAVLPGVTVEASSPVLIEKSRSATTDSDGRYQIIDLRPGTYACSQDWEWMQGYRGALLHLPQKDWEDFAKKEQAFLEGEQMIL